MARVSAWLLPRIALVGLVSCSASGRACAWCEDVGLSCAAIGYLCVDYEKGMHAIEQRKKACGKCGAGTSCNILEEPPRCTSDPGQAGVACGTYVGEKHAYVCAAGFRCNPTTKPSRCRALAKIGEACELEQDCAAGLGCSFQQRVCIAPHAAGERCQFTDTDGEETYEPCAEGLVCNDAESPPRCTQPTAKGGPCGRTLDCASGLRCVWDAGGLGSCVE
ncbi:MAG: hypothetical protein ACXVEE_31185 [Polyangiales bacterium]